METQTLRTGNDVLERPRGDASVRSLDSGGVPFTAQIRGVHSRFIQFVTKVAVADGQRLEVTFDGCVVVAEVVYCKLDNAGYVAGCRLGAGRTGEGRRDPRLPVDLAATLSVLGSSEATPIRVADISRTGFGLLLPVEFPVGSEVCLDFNAGLAFGEIKYCTERDGQFRAGFWIEEVLERQSTGARPKLAQVPTGSRESRVVAMVRRMLTTPKAH